MELTGKAKEMFKEWMKPNPLEHGRFGQLVTNTFDSMPESMQWGVIQDWADSLLFKTDIESMNNNFYFSYRITHGFNEYKDLSAFKTRAEARQAAIEKLNELINL